MTVKELSEKCGFEALCLAEPEREIVGVFCCDLLSVVMSKAFCGCAWVTIMGNVNSIAVAQLADMACIILAEGAAFDEMTVKKAEQQGINLLRSASPIFETSLSIHNAEQGNA